MYHYVRPIRKSLYQGIKGLEYSDFVDQLSFVVKNYSVIKIEDIIESIQENNPLPKRAALLTFDDGYLDHYQFVFPALKKYGLQGTFFAPVKAITERTLLDVNKIHYVLSQKGNGVDELILEVKKIFDQNIRLFDINSTFDEYYKQLAVKGRFDCEKTIFLKRMLQVALPEGLRGEIVSYLFKKYVTDDEEAFGNSLYMNQDQIQFMLDQGMHFGAHGNNHYWWNKLSSNDLEMEIRESKRFLVDLGISEDKLTVAYPYGAYNDMVIDKVRENNFKIGFTTEASIGNLSKDNCYVVPRFDTNDIIS